jgi:hypothetical protein
MWSRFEDAMNDLGDEESRLRGENQRLELEFDQLGIALPPEEEPKLEPVGERNYMDPMYRNKQEDVDVLRRRNQFLKSELEKITGAAGD